MWFIGMIYLKRNWDLDKNRIKNKLKKFAINSEARLPVWIVLFVEGSRMSQEKLKQVRL